MDWIQFFLVVQIVIVVMLIASVLLQPSSTDGLSGIGGGTGSSGGMGLLSGRAKATALSSATKWLAILFIANSLFLSILSGTGTSQKSSIEQKLLESEGTTEIEAIVPIEE